MSFSRPTIIFGCGNTLIGDDGYGPAVIARLKAEHRLSPGVRTIDAGTGVREHLFDYLLAPELRPAKMIILDAVDMPGHTPGEVFTLEPTAIPARKTHDFSLHQFPTVNLLQELQRETGIQITILAAQVLSLPDRVAPGLSGPMQQAVTTACTILARRFSPSRPLCHEQGI
jgi:coenzyme F420 hydrogenase subunit delta